jgi:metal-responsive CopG/Arc/MetJ family transcriptional regulator
MKTAISMPDDVFEAAEAAARRTGISRSQLFVEAVKLFLRKHGDRGVTERLDEVYGNAESKVDSALSAMQIATTRAWNSW